MNITDFRKVGEPFQLLGTHFVVTDINGTLHKITAMYKDHTGVIHSIVFAQDSLPALVAENVDYNYEAINKYSVVRAIERASAVLVEANSKVGMSMQGGYKDGVLDLHKELYNLLGKKL